MAHTCPVQSVLDMDVPVLMRMSTLPKTTQRRKIPGRPVRTLARSEPCIESSTWMSSEAIRPPVLTERRTNGQNSVGNSDTRSGRSVPPTASTEGQILAVQQHLMWLEERLKELQKVSDYRESGKGGCTEEKASGSNYYCITQGVDSNPGTSNNNSPVDGIDSTAAMTIGKENGAPLYSKQTTQKKRVSQGVCTVKSIPPMVRIDSLDAPNNVSTVLMDDRYQPYTGRSSNRAFQNLGTNSSLSRSPSPRVHLRGLDQLDATSTLSASTSSNLSPLSQDEHMAVRPVGFAQSISIFGPEGGSIGEDIWEFDGCDENAHSTTTPTPSGMDSLCSTNATTPNQPPAASPSAFHLGMQSLNVDSWSLDPSSGVPPSPALSNVSNCIFEGDTTQRPDGDGFNLKRLSSQTPTGGTPSPRSLKPTFSFTSSIISKAKARIAGRAIKKDHRLQEVGNRIATTGPQSLSSNDPDHDLEDLEMQTVRYKPEGIDKLCRSTKFTKKELQLMYRGFKQECPSGLVNEETFKEIYSQFFPQGDTGHPIYGRSKEPKNSSHYAHFVFNSFDTDHNGSITFEEFVTGLSVLSRGSLNDKLNWAFNLYDINGDGYITREEMLSIIQSIYDMMGKYSEPTSEDITPGEHVERVFQKMDLNKDGVVTIDEFIDSCRTDETITKSMHVFDTIL